MFEILLEEELHCSDWRVLNDPLEGHFSYGIPETGISEQLDETLQEFMEFQSQQIVNEKQKIKVCSLSKTFKSRRLWAHYASGFTGIAIEIDFKSKMHDLEKVSYEKNLPHVSFNQHQSNQAEVRKILTHKHKEWSYEREFRILHSQKKYSIQGMITSVLCGSRMNVSMMETFRIICESKGIPCSKVTLDTDGINTQPVVPYNSGQSLRD